MTDDEKDRALCEAHCNTAADEYFNARPQLDSDVNRRIFYAGHRKAWIERGEAVRLNAQAQQPLTDEKGALDLLNAENNRLMKLVIELRAEAARMNAQAVPDGYALVPVDAMKRWRDAFAEELSAWDIDPPLHHVQTSHDEIETLLSAAPAAPQPAPVEQTDARDAARWRYIAWHIGVAWNEQGFTSLVRIVSDKHREMLGDMVDRMMAGDWPEAAPQPAQQPLTDEQIKRIMLDNGFTIKEGLTDLKPYVYAAARALIAAATGVKND